MCVIETMFFSSSQASDGYAGMRMQCKIQRWRKVGGFNEENRDEDGKGRAKIFGFELLLQKQLFVCFFLLLHHSWNKEGHKCGKLEVREGRKEGWGGVKKTKTKESFQGLIFWKNEKKQSSLSLSLSFSVGVARCTFLESTSDFAFQPLVPAFPSSTHSG